MIDLKESIEGAEAILLKHWGKEDVPTHVIASAYAEAYGYLKQGVLIYLKGDGATCAGGAERNAIDRLEWAARLDAATRVEKPEPRPIVDGMPVGAFLDLLKERDQLLGAMCAAYDEKFKLQRDIVAHAMEWRLCDEAQPSPHEGACEHLDDLADACDALSTWLAEQMAEKMQ